LPQAKGSLSFSLLKFRGAERSSSLFEALPNGPPLRDLRSGAIKQNPGYGSRKAEKGQKIWLKKGFHSILLLHFLFGLTTLRKQSEVLFSIYLTERRKKGK
jgi:hypothetical protein